MKLLDIRERLIQMDLDLARSYQTPDTIKELLERMSTTILELQVETKQLRSKLNDAISSNEKLYLYLEDTTILEVLPGDTIV